WELRADSQARARPKLRYATPGKRGRNGVRYVLPGVSGGDLDCIQSKLDERTSFNTSSWHPSLTPCMRSGLADGIDVDVDVGIGIVSQCERARWQCTGVCKMELLEGGLLIALPEPIERVGVVGNPS
ncbi:hypothetical protein KEM52_000040, partial [Ascosphaera acerosa]